MTLGISSAVSGASNLWSLLSSRAASSASAYASSGTSTTTTSASDASSSARTRPDGPPPPPSQFDSAMSTAQFAQMTGAARGGPPPGEDPIASLDSDDDGSVSADEFGLDGASDDVQKLFAAMDEDGSGELSTDEIASFREQMMSADGARPPEPPPGPMGPPPGEGGTRGDSTGSTATDASSNTTTSTHAQPDIGQFLQQLAQRYASMTADSSESALSVTA